MATPARAEAAAILPVFLMNSRRELRVLGVSFMGDIFSMFTNRCQFKKSAESSERPWSAPPHRSAWLSPDVSWHHAAAELGNSICQLRMSALLNYIQTHDRRHSTAS